MTYTYRKRLLNEETEIQIGDCYFSDNDIRMIFIDQGNSIEGLAKRIGVGRRKANKILDKFNIPKSWTNEMTPRRLRVLRYIAYHQQKYNKNPSIKEIANKLLIPSCSVVYHVNKLVEYEFLIKKKYQREMTITPKGKRWCKNANAFNISSLEGNKRRKRGD